MPFVQFCNLQYLMADGITQLLPAIESRDVVGNHPVDQRAELVDFNLHFVADFQKFPTRQADARAGAGGNDIAGLQRDMAAEIGDLFGGVVDHLAGVGILLRARR